MQLSINIFKGVDYFIGTIDEFPEVLTQGKTFESAKANLLDALLLFIEHQFEESAPVESIG